MKEQFTEYPRSTLLQTVTDKEQTEKRDQCSQVDVIFSKVIGLELDKLDMKANFFY